MCRDLQYANVNSGQSTGQFRSHNAKPKVSLRKMSQETGALCSSTQRVLQKTTAHASLQDDTSACKRYCVCHIFSDEAWFIYLGTQLPKQARVICVWSRWGHGDTTAWSIGWCMMHAITTTGPIFLGLFHAPAWAKNLMGPCLSVCRTVPAEVDNLHRRSLRSSGNQLLEHIAQ